MAGQRGEIARVAGEHGRLSPLLGNGHDQGVEGGAAPCGEAQRPGPTGSAQVDDWLDLSVPNARWTRPHGHGSKWLVTCYLDTGPNGPGRRRTRDERGMVQGSRQQAV